MKHYMVEITYSIPADELGEIIAQHRAFLQTGYESGMLLFSGPKIPRSGGIVLARAASLDEVHEFFSNDPYQKNGVATYRFVEFNPVLSQSFMKNWIG